MAQARQKPNADHDQSDDAVVVQIVEQVAAAEGVEPVDLPPLAHSIDPDILERFVDSAQGGELAFPYAGRYVYVFFDGAVRIR